MELSAEEKQIYIETAKRLTGSDRRMFMARVVKSLGRGGQRLAASELGWGRNTIIKGCHELESGIVCIDNFSARGRKRAEDHLPHLLVDIQAREIVKCCGRGRAYPEGLGNQFELPILEFCAADNEWNQV